MNDIVMDFNNPLASFQKYSYVEMEFFLPNGQYFSMNISPTYSLAKVKSLAWQHASTYPLFEELKKHNCYVFSYIDSDSSLKTILNDSITLIDIQLGKPLLIIVENEEFDDNSGESKISKLLAPILGEKFFKSSSIFNEEFQDFLNKFIPICSAYILRRSNSKWENNFLYFYPPDIGSLPNIPSYLSNECNEENGYDIAIYLVKDANTKFKTTINVLESPNKLLEKAFSMLQQKNLIKNTSVSDYVLKVVGQDIFFVGEFNKQFNMIEDVPLIRYNYIRNCISLGAEPLACIVEKSQVYLPNFSKYIPEQKLSIDANISKHFTSLWSLDSSIKFNVVVGAAENISDSDCQYFVQGGIFMGDVRLSEVQQTKMKNGPNPIWNEKLTFDIALVNLPRAAKLCLSICSVPSSKSVMKKKEGAMTKECWCNINIFNHNGSLIAGTNRIGMWKYSDPNANSTLQPLGTVCSPPTSHFNPVLKLLFNNYPIDVSYPLKTEVIKYGESIMPPPHVGDLTYETITIIGEILKTEYLMPLSEFHKAILWENKHYLKSEKPASIKRLAESVQWNRKDYVSQFIFMLQTWPKLSCEESLMLLDGRFPLEELRTYAVDCLYSISDEKLEWYLLQIVECLKLEPYIDSTLCNFILDRSLSNSRIGHFFFWQLKSESCEPENYERFSTILKAYFNGAPHAISDFTKQVEFISKLRTLTELMIQQNDMDTETRKQLLRKCLSIKAYSDVLSNLTNPLEPRIKVGAIKVDKCDVKESKKKPLVICWENMDPIGTDVSVLFKNGDDLRQDILTLKTFRIMDMIWKENGYDFKLIPYGVLATGHMCGLIELVGISATLSKIQVERGFKKTVLYDWLQEKHNGEQMKNQINLFRLSCCGYSIATFVLGIGDRHNDNVMLKENGQLFHIDFGHILGNFKSFFGIKRERVPFILTKDFIYLATNTNDDKDSDEFKAFLQLCENSFLIIRDKSNLLIVLFSLMISSGMPELNKIEDLQFLRNTLVVGKDKEQASIYFQEKFKEAYNGSWMTQLNFRAHSMRITQAQSNQTNAAKFLNNMDMDGQF